MRLGFSQGTGRQEGTLKVKGPGDLIDLKDNLLRAEQSILIGRRPRVSGKGDEELLKGLQHNRNIQGANMETGYPEEAQKYILGMQGQNWACQISTGVKTGEECGGQQGRPIHIHLKAKENEAALSQGQRIQQNLNCSVPSVSQSSLPRFSLGPSSPNWLAAEFLQKIKPELWIT